MALDTNKLKNDLLNLYSDLNKYDNSKGKKPEDARRVLSERLSIIIDNFIKSGSVKITIGENTYHGTIE